MLKQEKLLTVEVTTMSRKVASQIRMARYPDPVYKAILNGCKHDTLRPIGWVDGEHLPSNTEYGPIWLMNVDGGLWWIKAPYQGDPDKAMEDQKDWMVLCTKDLKQIFLK
jgi:hypothetical protein